MRRRIDGAGGSFLIKLRWSFWRSLSPRNLPIMFAGICAALIGVKLVPGHEGKPSIGAGRGSLESSMKEAARCDHDHAGAIRMVWSVEPGQFSGKTR
jgi:hypothetical protein